MKREKHSKYLASANFYIFFLMLKKKNEKNCLILTPQKKYCFMRLKEKKRKIVDNFKFQLIVNRKIKFFILSVLCL